nr:hypothetical protein [Tanacetum cinerariifolium]
MHELFNNTILDASPGYIRLHTHYFSLANLRLPLNDFFYELAFSLYRNIDNNDLDVFQKLFYTEDDTDLTFLPKYFSLGFNTSSPSVSINMEPVKADEEPIVKPTTEPATEPVNESLRLFRVEDTTAFHLKISSITPPTWKGFLDNHLDVDLLDLHDHCYARQVVVDNAVNRRSCEFWRLLRSLRVILLALEPKVTSLEAEKANLEATEALLREEIEEVKHDWREVVSKVVPYACIGLLHSDELGRLVRKLVSSAITFDRCRAYEQVAKMKEPFDLLKVKGYRPSYEKEHTQVSDDLATATFSWLNEYVADASIFVDALLSKKPPLYKSTFL